VISGGNASVSGESITASVAGKSISTSGDTSAASIGVPASNVAKADARVADDTSDTTPSSSPKLGDTDDKKRKAKPIKLTRKSGRVTVILPPSNNQSPRKPNP
jgi:hypothetical protein